VTGQTLPGSRIKNMNTHFTRKKSGVPVIVNLGTEALNIFKDLPAEGPLSRRVRLTFRQKR